MADASADRGAATAELAVALPAVVVVLAAVLSVGQAVLTQVSCVDAARAGARAAARGDDLDQVRSAALAAVPRARVTPGRSPGRSSMSFPAATRWRSPCPGQCGCWRWGPPSGCPLGPLRTVSSRPTPRRPHESTARADRGSATVLVLGVCLVTFDLVTTVAALGSAVAARHRAESVADLGVAGGG